jgi:hypothetical protein
VEFHGIHKAGKTNADVVTIEFAWDTSNLTYLPFGYLKSFPNLKHLNTGRTNLKSLRPEAFQNATSLAVFNSYNNQIQTLEARVFAGAPNLEEINLSSNLIQTIDEAAFSNLEHLKTLFLDNNLLVSFEPLTFRPLKSVKVIDLGLNRIEYIQENLFEVNPLLKNLILRNNSLSLIESGAFKADHQNLTTLDLKHNPCIDKHYSPPDQNQLQIDLKNCWSFGFSILRMHRIEREWKRLEKGSKKLVINQGVTIPYGVIGCVLLLNLLIIAGFVIVMYRRVNRKLDCLTIKTMSRFPKDSYYEDVDGEEIFLNKYARKKMDGNVEIGESSKHESLNVAIDVPEETKDGPTDSGSNLSSVLIKSGPIKTIHPNSVQSVDQLRQ